MEKEGSDEHPFANCPVCSRDTEHEVIKRTEKGSGEDVLARCLECQNFHTIIIRAPKPVKIRTTLSDGRESDFAEIDADEDENISIGDFFEHQDKTWKVTRIENSFSRPEEGLIASEILSMWAVRTDRMEVGITMTEGEFSESAKMECEPDRVFSCGSIIHFEEKRWKIRAIHTGSGRTLSGSRVASDIRRIYLHSPYSAD